MTENHVIHRIARMPALAVVRGSVVALLLAVWSPGLAAATDFDRLYQDGQAARQAGDHAAAERLFGEALALQPDNADVLLFLGLVQGYQQKYDAARATLSRGLTIAPDYADLMIALARVHGWTGRYGEAQDLLDAVLARDPDNLEARALMGRLALYQQRHDAAESVFRSVLEAKPDDYESLLGLGDSLAAQGLQDGARETFQRALLLYPDATEVRERLERAVLGGLTPWRVDIGYIHSSFQRRPLDDWREAFAHLSRRLDGGTVVDVGFQSSRRHGLRDDNLQAGVYQSIAHGFGVYARAEVTPSADFLPRWGVAVEFDWQIHDGADWAGPTQLSLGLRHRHYPTVDVSNADPGLRQYLWRDRLWLTGRWINAYDDSIEKRLTGWLTQLDWRPLDGIKLHLGRAKAPETDLGETVDVFTTYGGIVVDLTSRLGLRLDYTRDKRKESYVRRAVSVSLTVRF